MSRDNLKMPANVQRAYLEVVAQAVARVNSGMAGYEQATREAVLKLARRGVSVVDYKSGAWAQADVAMRRHMRTQVIQAGSRNTLELLEDDVCTTLLLTEGPTRAQDERVKEFAARHTKKLTCFDTKEYARPGISDEFRPLLSPVVVHRYIFKMFL